MNVRTAPRFEAPAAPAIRDRRQCARSAALAIHDKRQGLPFIQLAPAALALAVALLNTAPAAAQQAQSIDDEAIAEVGRPGPAPAAVAALRSGDIAIDGRLDEEAWLAATVATGFVQREPVEGTPAEHETEVRVLFDGRAIYVGARMHDPAPQTIARQLVRRDEDGQYDLFEVALDPNQDRRTGYLFRVSAADVQGDEYLYDDSNSDLAWDAVWESAVQTDDGGWTAELRIPLSQIRYDAIQGIQQWGVNFRRIRVSTNEETHYALISQLQQGVVSQFASLDGIRIDRSPRRIELRPYMLSSNHRGPTTEGDPFFDGNEAAGRVGIDLRYGLGSAFTLDATINPDFGQVEADPAVINLSAFETFFDERRPFFVEDARVFDFSLSGGQNKLFYSRRVGRTPQGGLPGGPDFTNVPDATTIQAAAKLTGRTAGGLSVGALVAQTDGEMGEGFFLDSGLTESHLVEPQSQYGVLRLQKDFRNGETVIGGIATGMHRNLPTDGSFDFLTSTAYNAGIDFEHQWNDREWALHGFFAGSHVRGDSTALTRIQRSSNHYFHRPDALWLDIDSTRTSMTGFDWRLQLDRRRAEHWTGSIWAAQVTPGFEINDMGFSRNQERLDGGFRVSYREIVPGTLFRNYNINFFTFHNWSHDALKDTWSLSSWDRAHVSGSFNLNGNVQLLNYWNVNGNFSWRPEMMDRTATRGGPLVLNPSSRGVRLNVSTDPRKAVNIGPSFNHDWSAMGAGSRTEIGVRAQIRPSSRVEIEVQPSFSKSRDGAQYVASTGVLPFEPTFGSRYIFGDLERRELSMQTRLNVAFTPRLSLQLFAQPLLSTGDYLTYRQLERPETYDFDVFGEGTYLVSGESSLCSGGDICVDPSGRQHVDFDGDGVGDYSFSDRDFNFRSLIGNMVLRWEYRPGSTVFLVWQRRQSQRAPFGDFDFDRDFDALWGAPADDVFMVKVNYWFGL